MPLPNSFFVLAASVAFLATLDVTSSHDHKTIHSHLCEGAGYNIFCSQGLRLKILTAWYGRRAHDRESCVVNRTLGQQKDFSHLEPELGEHCGASVMATVNTWCPRIRPDPESGCTITVQNLDPEQPDKPCPETVHVKYLYLEYVCENGRSGGVKTSWDIWLLLVTVTAVLGLMSFR